MKTLFMVVAVCVALSGVASARDRGPRDLNNYLCKDVMRMCGENCSIAICERT